MAEELSSLGGDGDAARCAWCGALAAGACARCQCPVCGTCSVLTTGGARTWAICPDCDAAGGASLRAEWMVVAGWILGPILVLFAATILYVMLRN